MDFSPLLLTGLLGVHVFTFIVASSCSFGLVLAAGFLFLFDGRRLCCPRSGSSAYFLLPDVDHIAFFLHLYKVFRGSVLLFHDDSVDTR